MANVVQGAAHTLPLPPLHGFGGVVSRSPFQARKGYPVRLKNTHTHTHIHTPIGIKTGSNGVNLKSQLVVMGSHSCIQLPQHSETSPLGYHFK